MLYNAGFDVAQKACPEDNTHIVLNRPHTVLLLASMREGSAQRGAYTDAMAKELKRADGRSIADMHQNAVAEMTKQYGADQTPEMRSTLKKKLVLRRTNVSKYGENWVYQVLWAPISCERYFKTC